MTSTVKSRLYGTKTEQNLRDALTGEEHSFTKYSMLAEDARRAGDYALARKYEDTARNECSHARLWAEYLGDNEDTKGGLSSSVADEQYRAGVMYPEYADVADDEGFAELADKFRLAGIAEQGHGDIFASLLRDYSNGDRYEGSENTLWECHNCGYRIKATIPPERCPLCSARQSSMSKA